MYINYSLFYRVNNGQEINEICSSFGNYFVGVLEYDVLASGLNIEKDMIEYLESDFPKEIEVSLKIPSEILFQNYLLSLPYAPLKSVVVEEKDYVEEYYHKTGSVLLGSMFEVIPSWKNKSSNDKYPIYIDPSYAFGTGEHYTTSLSVKNIELLFKNASIEKVLDVGSGSGILAIVCRMLGAKEVNATEIDELAMEVAKKNFCKLNLNISLYRIGEGKGLESQFTNKFDLIISNILLQTNIDYKKAYAALLKQGGFLILSGTLHEQKEDLWRAFSDEFEIEFISHTPIDPMKEGWTNLILKKK